ncbi:MAG: hypothetical protein HGA85_06895 [Nanoarchaeota archaeon]|nr:hypothetical protein [Nanoarchaeota archaeon]
MDSRNSVQWLKKQNGVLEISIEAHLSRRIQAPWEDPKKVLEERVFLYSCPWEELNSNLFLSRYRECGLPTFVPGTCYSYTFAGLSEEGYEILSAILRRHPSFIRDYTPGTES